MPPGKWHDYRDAMVFEKLCSQNDFLYTLKRKAGVLKNLRFRDELVCSANCKNNLELRFKISPT